MCGHAMHAKCFFAYFGANRYRHVVQGRPVALEPMEFLCPLCKSIGNILVPMATKNPTIDVPTTMTSADVNASSSSSSTESIVRSTFVTKMLLNMVDRVEKIGFGRPLSAPTHVVDGQVNGRATHEALRATVCDYVLEQLERCRVHKERDGPTSDVVHVNFARSVFDHSHPFNASLRRLRPYVRAVVAANAPSKNATSNAQEILWTKCSVGLKGRPKKLACLFGIIADEENMCFRPDTTIFDFVLRIGLLVRTAPYFDGVLTDDDDGPRSVDRILSGFATALCATYFAVLCYRQYPTSEPTKSSVSEISADEEVSLAVASFVNRLARNIDSGEDVGGIDASISTHAAWRAFRPFCRQVAALLQVDPQIERPRGRRHRRRRTSSGGDSSSGMEMHLSSPRGNGGTERWWRSWPPEVQFAKRLSTFMKRMSADVVSISLWRRKMSLLSAMATKLAPVRLPSRRLISLPASFIELYSSTTNRPCAICKKRPPMPALCLLCGEIVCVGACAEEGPRGPSRVGNLAKHHRQCSGSVGAFLFLRTGSVLICRGGFVAQLPSIYVDEHGEGMRGTSHDWPLFLNAPRYEAIRKIWGTREIASKVTSMRSGAPRVILYNYY